MSLLHLYSSPWFPEMHFWYAMYASAIGGDDSVCTLQFLLDGAREHVGVSAMSEDVSAWVSAKIGKPMEPEEGGQVVVALTCHAHTW